MLKIFCVAALALVSASCTPIESTSSKLGLNRPSPINPDVISDPKPAETLTTIPERQKPVDASNVGNIQKIPARGIKLSSELDQQKSSTTAAPKQKRQIPSTVTPAKPAFKRDQLPISSTKTPRHQTTTTAEPVSLKTPIVHSSGAKNKRSVDGTENNTDRSNSTRSPLASSGSDNNDDSGPHFVRPVPVEQILKNIHEAQKRQQPSTVINHHDDIGIVSSTTPAGVAVNDHKVHHKATTSKPESNDTKDDGNDDNSSSSEEKESKN